MGFIAKILEQITFTAPVEIEGARFTAVFRLLDDQRMKQLAEEGDEQFIQAVLADWDGVEDEQGQPLACTPEAVSCLCRYAIAREAILRAYFLGLSAKLAQALSPQQPARPEQTGDSERAQGKPDEAAP